MSVIRGETVHIYTILSPKGELIANDQSGWNELIEEESRKAFQKGEMKGEKLGYTKARQEAKEVLNLLKSIVQKNLEQKNRLLEAMKPEVIEFCMKVCERIIRRELAHPEALVKLLHSLLKVAIPVTRHEWVHVILSADDFVMMERHFSEIQCDIKKIEEMRFLSDPSMKRGDVRIETPSGLLNYEISRQLFDLQSKVMYGL